MHIVEAGNGTCCPAEDFAVAYCWGLPTHTVECTVYVQVTIRPDQVFVLGTCYVHVHRHSLPHVWLLA